MDFINAPILLFSLVLVMSILTSLISSRANVPLILVFLCVGMIFGDSGLGLIQGFQQPKVAFFIGSLALALILFDSGYQTNFKSVKKTLKPAIFLATVGVFFTALFLAPAAHYIGGFSWFESFLLSSIISSTDAAAVFFVLRMGGVSIREKIKSTLEMESGSNDPMAIFLTFSFLTLYAAGSTQGSLFLGLNFVMQMGLGVLAGFGLGWLIKFVINRVDFDAGLYPVLVIGMALAGFALTSMLNGSGFLALYISGMLVGQARLKGHHQTLRFQTTLTWLSQIVLFLTLGFYVDIWRLPHVAGTAFALGLVLLLFARPLAVFICLAPFQYSLSEKFFISFVGLRGATSVLLALAPLVKDVPAGDSIFAIIFLMVLMSLFVQGLLIVPAAKKCHVVLPVLDKPAEKSEIDLPGLSDSYLITYHLTETTPAVQGAKIPRWAMPVFVQRGDISYSGANVKTLRADDQIYVFAIDEKHAVQLDKLYGGGQLEVAPENMGDFILNPDILLKELAYLYNVSVPASWGEMNLRDALEKNFSDLEVGDRFAFGKIELVIRKKENGVITEVGLNLEPQKTKRDFSRLLQFKRNETSKPKNN